MAHKIIIDTDPGVDDAAAILLARNHPQVELLGLTTVFGNAGIEAVTRNALRLERLFGLGVPVARGAGRALARAPGRSPVHVHGEDGLGDVGEEFGALPEPDGRPAHRLICDLVRQYPGEVSLLAIGRMTNLAMALNHDPGIAGLVRGVVMMGGAFGTAGPNGNVTPVAEANIIGDSHAADQVFAAEWPVVAVGLDVTRKTVLGPADFEAIGKKGAAQAFLARMTQGYIGYHQRFGVEGCYVHDSAALAYLVRPELFATRSGPVRVATEGVAMGQTVQYTRERPHPPNAWDGLPDQRVAVDVDAEGVRRLLLEFL